MTRVVIAHQAVAADAPPDERDTLEAADAVQHAVESVGWTTERLAMSLDLADVATSLSARPPDLVFNLVEGLPGVPGPGSLVAVAAELFQALNIRFTGASPAALALTSSKPAMRRVLRASGVAVAPGPEHGAPGPYIVKHAFEHASFGLGAHSVVAELPAALPSGWFAEAFIDGREFNVSIVEHLGEPLVLPVAELVFAADWPGAMPRILDYHGKWRPDHFLYARSVRRVAELPPELAARLRATAEACWRVLGLAGYARVDIRMDAGGAPYVIDVNANPSLAPDAGFAATALSAGIDYPGLVRLIVEAALPRPRAAKASALASNLEPRGAARQIVLRDDLQRDDAAPIVDLCRASGFFTAGEIAVAAELIEDRLRRGDDSDYCFLIAETTRGGLVGYACFGPTPCTEGAWDLYWIVVGRIAQRTGIGRRLVEAVAARVAEAGGRRLFAETSGRLLYGPTQAFYAGTGFQLQAVVPDFYAEGDAKQIWMRRASLRQNAATAGMVVVAPAA